MDEKTFKARMKKLAVAIINEVNKLPRRELPAACRAKSVADMINKLKIVEEEVMKHFIGLNFLLRLV